MINEAELLVILLSTHNINNGSTSISYNSNRFTNATNLRAAIGCINNNFKDTTAGLLGIRVSAYVDYKLLTLNSAYSLLGMTNRVWGSGGFR